MKGTRLGVAATFLILGPAISGIVIALMMVAQAPNQDAQSPGWVTFVAGFGMIYAFFLAGIPAAVIAVVAALGSRFIANNWAWIGACAVAGAAICVGFISLGNWDGEGLAGMDIWTLYGACGAGASALCAAVCIPFRPRRADPLPETVE